MDAEWRTRLAGEPVHLLGGRALWRPRARALLVADLHLGKGDAFRRAGLAIPGGGTALDLRRLDALLAGYPAEVLWILGDLLHGPAPRAHWLAAWRTWRAGHPGLRIRVLRGNHDRAFAASVLDVEDAGGEQRDGPFLLRHDPRPAPGAHVLCGTCIRWPPCPACTGAGRRSGCAKA